MALSTVKVIGTQCVRPGSAVHRTCSTASGTAPRLYHLALPRVLQAPGPVPAKRHNVRHASAIPKNATRLRILGGLKRVALGASVAICTLFGYFYITDARSSIHRWVVVPAIRNICRDAEEAHHVGVTLLKVLYRLNLHPRDRGDTLPGSLGVHVFGHDLDNPIGTSAGIDKDADIPSALLALGSAIVEVGGVTPRPQDGNPKPRVFRIQSQNALINRYGLNSKGADYLVDQLRQRVKRYVRSQGLGIGEEAENKVLCGETGVPPGSLTHGKLLAVQVAKNKSTPDNDVNAVRKDYVACVEKLARYADIITVNVSSPNTPGLRGLQQKEPLQHILRGVVDAARCTPRYNKPAVMVKVSPDEDSEEDVFGVCEAVWASGVDGVIVGNTTKERPDPLPIGAELTQQESNIMLEQGGYSGPQLFQKTVALVKRYRTMLDKALEAHPKKQLTPKVIFATGGITNGKQALEVLEAGASVAQVYTAMVYGGVGTITRIKDEIRYELSTPRPNR